MRFKGLDAFTIKIIACVAMLADHIGLLFFPDVLFLREFGRLAFPLFAFLLTEGVIKTSDTQKYIFRLMIFALISQIPYSFLQYISGGNISELNIFFLLALGVGMLAAMRQVKKIWLQIPIIPAIAVVAEITNIGYGAYGIMIILATYLVRQNFLWAGISLFVGGTAFVTLVIPELLWVQLFAMFSLPIMAMYSHKPGPKISRWFFYWFYPVHIAVLAALYLILAR